MNNTYELKSKLEELTNNSKRIFIIGHNDPDFDAIGSAIGLQRLYSYLGKEAYIIVDDIDLSAGVKKIIEEAHNSNRYNIINKEKYNSLKQDNSLLIMTDVNKDYLISLKDNIKEFNNIAIIDHHKEDKNTVNTENKYININKSSASEIVSSIYSYYPDKIMDAKTANYLLAGIVLDTNRFRKNTTEKTLNIAKKLVRKGAKLEFVEELFLEEYEDDKKIYNLVMTDNNIFKSFQTSDGIFNRNIAFTFNRDEPFTIYRREDLAKAADRLLKYKVDASFALGYTKEDLVSISGRSKSEIDVSEILSNIPLVNGGGNPTSAGASTNRYNILELELLLESEVNNYLGNTINKELVLTKKKN